MTDTNMPEDIASGNITPEDIAIDPVCHMKVDIKKNKKLKTTFNDKTYYFCNIKCLQKFEANPTNYIETAKPEASPVSFVNEDWITQAQSNEDQPTEASDTGWGIANIYTCPMDPQIRQSEPGSCPICGMMLEPVDVFADDSNDQIIRDYSWRLIFSFIGALIIMLLEHSLANHWVSGSMLGGPPDGNCHCLNKGDLTGIVLFGSKLSLHTLIITIQTVVASTVVYFGGMPIFSAAWLAAKNRSLNMFSLITVGVMASYLFSLVRVVQSILTGYRDLANHLYYESACMILALVLLGQVLEHKARAKSKNALKELIGGMPKKVRKINADGQEEEIDINNIKVGNILRVLPGEKFAFDGQIQEGKSEVDESMLTGEVMPVVKAAGDTVVSGTLNLNGALTVKATQVGANSLFAKLLKAVLEAQSTRPTLEYLADRIAKVFVPTVFAIALITFIYWTYLAQIVPAGLNTPAPRASVYNLQMAIMFATAVLIIACPCALGLATPISTVVALGKAAKEGILFRSATALEMLSKVNVIVFDKTGTLTKGKPELVSTATTDKDNPDEDLILAASLCQASEHPLASALVNAAKAKHLTLSQPQNVQIYPGQGLSGTVNNKAIVLGNNHLIKDAEKHLFNNGTDNSSGTFSYLQVDNEIIARFGFEDQLKDGVQDVINKLKSQGKRLIILSGDSTQAVQKIADKLGISEIHAQITPEKKLAFIEDISYRNNNVVAMLGDGINDAAALSKAHIGIAMGNGTDLAMESADIVLVKGNIEAIPRLFSMSSSYISNIKQNLFLAFIYNVLAIPLAAGVLYESHGIALSPVIASIAMSASSISVIANALRLRWS